MSTVGCYLEYRRGYHDARGGYHEYRRGCSVPWGYHPLKFEYRGDIMSTVGGVQYRGVLK